MRIRYNTTEAGRFAAGDEAEVSDEVGSALVCSGVADCIGRERPESAPISSFPNRPKPVPRSFIANTPTARRAMKEGHGNDKDTNDSES